MFAKAFDKMDEELLSKAMQHIEIMFFQSMEYEMRCRFYFSAIWKLLLEDRDECIAYVRYYYSPYFTKYSVETHKRRFKPLVDKFRDAFKDEADVWMILNHILNVMLDFAVKVHNGEMPDSVNYSEHVFRVIYRSVEQYFRKPKESDINMKKVLNIIKTTLVWLVVLLAVSMMIFTVVSVTTFNRNDRDLFGFKMYIVNSDSMAATDFNAGDLILVKEVDPSALKEGDIITFMSQDTDSFGETITHKIRKVTTDAEGNPGFITYGTTTGVDDDTIVTYPYVLGQYQSRVPGLGTFFNFLKTTPGYFVCIFAPFMLIILYEGLKFFNLFRRYKKEQMEEMQAEKDKIEAEKLENAKMLEELRALKAQLEGGQSPVAAATVTEDSASDNAPGAETE